MSGQIKAADGSATSPSITFGSDTNSGLYSIGADEVGLAVGGSKVLDISATGLAITGALSATTNLSAGGNLTVTGTAATGNLTVTGSVSATSLTVTGGLGANSVVTASITNANVTYAKIQNVTNNRLLGNFSGSASAPSEYSLSADFVVGGSAIKTYGPKAWATVTLSGTTLTIQKSFNIASIVRNTTGRFTVTFTNNMTDAFYVPLCIVQGVSGDGLFAVIHTGTTPSVSSFQIDIITISGSDIDPAYFSFAVFGN